MSYFDEEEYKESKFDLNIWKKVFSHMDPLKKHLYIGIGAAIGLGLIDTLYPLLNRYALDDIIASGTLEKLPYFIAGYLILSATIATLVFTFIIHAGQIQQKLSYILRKKAFKRLHELPFSYYDKTPVGWIMARMTSDSRNLSDILSWSLIDLTWGIFTMIRITIVVLIVNWKLALILIIMLRIIMV